MTSFSGAVAADPASSPNRRSVSTHVAPMSLGLFGSRSSTQTAPWWVDMDDAGGVNCVEKAEERSTRRERR